MMIWGGRMSLKCVRIFLVSLWCKDVMGCLGWFQVRRGCWLKYKRRFRVINIKREKS